MTPQEILALVVIGGLAREPGAMHTHPFVKSSSPLSSAGSSALE